MNRLKTLTCPTLRESATICTVLGRPVSGAWRPPWPCPAPRPPVLQEPGGSPGRRARPLVRRLRWGPALLIDENMDCGSSPASTPRWLRGLGPVSPVNGRPQQGPRPTWVKPSRPHRPAGRPPEWRAQRFPSRRACQSVGGRNSHHPERLVPTWFLSSPSC